MTTAIRLSAAALRIVFFLFRTACGLVAAILGWVFHRLLRRKLVGSVRAIDGDTVSLILPSGEEARVRIWGIDAPERGQRQGREATAMLIRLIADRPVTFHPRTRDRYGRLVGELHDADGRDIANEMVAGGYALADRRYTRRYLQAEAAARRASRGLWAEPGGIADPRAFRAIRP